MRCKNGVGNVKPCIKQKRTESASCVCVCVWIFVNTDIFVFQLFLMDADDDGLEWMGEAVDMEEGCEGATTVLLRRRYSCHTCMQQARSRSSESRRRRERQRYVPSIMSDSGILRPGNNSCQSVSIRFSKLFWW